MRPIPIFDTNVFGDVQRVISAKDWRYLVRHRPGRGWPLSQVTALELLAGVHAANSHGFFDAKQRINLAFDLSRGRVLEDPRSLLCKEVLRLPFPPENPVPFPADVSKHLDGVRRTKSWEYLQRVGLPTSIFAEVMTGPKQTWIQGVELVADKISPGWRHLEKATGRRLLPEKRKEVKPRSAWQDARPELVKSLLVSLRASTGPETVSRFCEKLDAVLEFTIWVAREFLLGTYKHDQHESDVFDQFQLHYLAMDRFVIVSADADLLTRVQKSTQAARIMSFDQFLSTL